ncbi:MAG TPA: hypothetical protein VF290_17400, partial [Pyrinomonadaceae bacterium]
HKKAQKAHTRRNPFGKEETVSKEEIVSKEGNHSAFFVMCLLCLFVATLYVPFCGCIIVAT